ncbi:uncharacterized protein LOC119094363, partial [Pollicipes pollicipes]|uniref:uncharacterized protein LOC119094363 n=1 Tax=Pollicipes pollicipes TaxID=41117 RepID=UPI0018850E71
LLVSTWRSGSTYLAELLASHPGVFYHHEPLLLCQQDLRLVGRACRAFPVHLVKTLRLELAATRWLLANTARDVRVVWLYRDPRAVVHARAEHVDQCSGACVDPRAICADLAADDSAATRLARDFPSRFVALRYEDLARLGLRYTDLTERFVHESAARGDDATSGSSRSLGATARAWLAEARLAQVLRVQAACSEVIRELRYRPLAPGDTTTDFEPCETDAKKYG